MNTKQRWIWICILAGASVAVAQLRSSAPHTWNASIQDCKDGGREVFNPLEQNQQEVLIQGVNNTAERYWTSLLASNESIEVFEWKGIGFYGNISQVSLPWKPGERPNGTSNNSCVAIEVTKLSVSFYLEDCSTMLFSYCRTVNAQGLFTRYEDPSPDLPSALPILELTDVETSASCAHECVERSTCVTFTYLSATRACNLFDTRKVETDKNVTKTIARCATLVVPDNSNNMNGLSNKVGDVHNVSCKEDYTPTPSTVSCQPNGRWTEYPSCIADVRDCLPGQVSYEGICYQFPDSRVTWHAAHLGCQSLGGHLLEVKDAAKMAVVDKLLFGRENDTFWIGASDEIKDSWFHWTREYSQISYTRWHSEAGDPSGHCVQLKRTWNGVDKGRFFFDATNCSQPTYTICEIGRQHVGGRCDDDSWCRGRASCKASECRCMYPYNELVGSNASAFCDRDRTLYNGYRFSEIPDSLPYDIAMAACKREGGALMAPISHMMDLALKQFYTRRGYDKGIYYWSSLKKNNSKYEDFGIAEFDDILEDYLPWRDGRSSSPAFTSTGNCVVVEVSKAGPKLLKEKCTFATQALCSMVSSPERATVQLGASVSLEPMQSLWTSTSEWCGAECLSQVQCTSYGFTTSDRTCRLFNDTAGTGVATTMDFWTRSACAPITSVLYGAVSAVSGSTAVNSVVTYSCNNFTANVANVSVTCQSNTLWSQLPMCQPNDQPCPGNWMRWGTGCYLIVEETLSWSAAAEACQNRDGYLVEINGDEERQFVVDILDFDRDLVVWTGGNDIGLQHWYRWRQYPFTDIRVLDWFPGTDVIPREPTGFTFIDDERKNQDCIELRKNYDGYYARRHYYSDADCEAKQAFMCETKVFNVGSPGCAAYPESPCKSIAECVSDHCVCPNDTHRQTGQDGHSNAICDIIQPIGGKGCKSRNDLCFNQSVCINDGCKCPSPLIQNGQDNSFVTTCESDLPGCSGDWRAYDNKCYKLFRSREADRNPDQECIQKGGLLASPVDQDLNDFLLLLGSRSNKWMSLHGRQGELRWADGTVMGAGSNYTNFRAGADTNILINETCVYLSIQGGWVKDKCYESSPSSYVCATPKLCHTLPQVTNAINKTISEFVPVGTEYEYECDSGFVIDGVHTGRIVCHPTMASYGPSIWDTPPSCVSIVDSVFGDAEEGYGLTATPAVNVTDMQTCAVKCYNSGEACVAFSLTEDLCQLYTAISQVSADFIPFPPGATVKKRIACPSVPVVSNAVMTSGTNRTVGSVLTYACTPLGRIMPGSSLSISCGSNGQWEKFPICQDRFQTFLIDTEDWFSSTKRKAYYNIQSLQDCQMKCITEKEFRCLSLNYDHGDCVLYMNRLRNQSRNGVAAHSTIGIYAELTESDLNEFHTMYNRAVTGIPTGHLTKTSMEECAQACLQAQFVCLAVVYNTASYSCQLFDTIQGTLATFGSYVFQRHLGCDPPQAIPGMTSSDVIRKAPGQYSVGDQLRYTCTNLGEDFTDKQDGLVHCQQGGKWTRLPTCRNLCEAGWYYWNGSCYQVYKTPRTFKQAHAVCTNVYATLFNVNKPYELNLTDQIRQNKSMADTKFWLGLYSDLNTWKWTVPYIGDTRALAMDVPVVEPESAIVVDVAVNTLIRFSILTDTAAFVCKKALPRLRCPDDWYYFNHTCYHIPTTAADSYGDAENWCSNQGHTLVTPHSAHDMDFIKYTVEMSEVAGYVYTGLMKPANEDWKYADGSTHDWTHATGANVEILQEMCYLVGATGVSLASCTKRRRFVCQAPLATVGVATDYSDVPCVTNHLCEAAGLKCIGYSRGGLVTPPTCRHPDCPSTMRFEQGKCFLISDREDNFAGATAECGKLGGRVTSIGSMADNNLWLELSERQFNSIRGFWVGYDSYASSDRLKTNVLETEFTHWANQQPEAGRACTVSSRRLDAVGVWMSVPCNGTYPYICEVDVHTNKSTNQAYYEGCFSATISPFPPTNKYKLTSSSTMDIKTCRDHCLNLGFRYASAKLAVECTCGNSVNVGARVRESSCNLPCRGDNSEKCGGTSYHSVYRTSDNVCSATMPSDPTDPLHCYTMSLHQLDWYTGRFSCGRNRGDLVSIQSIEKQAFLVQNVYSEPASFAEKVSIGVYQQNNSHFNYYYVDNNVTAIWKYFFTNWNENNGDDLDCAMSDVHTGEWIHGKCGTASIKNNFVCEYKQKRRTVTGNIWRRLETATEKASISVTINVVVSRNEITFNHDTKLYSDDLDLGCLNDRELCPNGFTFVFWIFIDSQATSDMEVLSTGSCVSQYAVGVGVCVYYVAASNNLIINDSTNKTSNRVARLTVGKGSWHHLALVFDGGTTMYAHMDGGSAHELIVDASLTTTLTSTMIYEQILFGNWHDVSVANNSFKLRDVRFKPQKMMWNEINSLFGDLQPTTDSVSWLKDDISTARTRRTVPDPGVDGRGLRFNQHGSVAFLSDNKTCADKLHRCMGPFTYAFWVKVGVPSYKPVTVLTVGDVPGGKQGLKVAMETDTLHVSLVVSAGMYSAVVSSVISGKWHHITLMFDTSLGLSVYQDGVLAVTATSSGSGVGAAAAQPSLTIGQGVCPMDWLRAGTSCYYLNRSGGRFWTDARVSKDVGAHHVHIDSDEEYQFVQDLMMEKGISQLLLGYYEERPDTQRFVRVPGGPETYMTDSLGGGGGEYRRLVCSGSACTVANWAGTSIPTLYEMELTQTEFPVVSECPVGWEYFHGSCYKHMGLDKVSAVTAQEKCAEVWAYPVEVDSHEELRFVANLTYRSSTTESTIVSVSYESMPDGTGRFVNRNWRPPGWDSWNYRPLSNDQCVQLKCSSGGCYYDDISCMADKTYYICERSAGTQCGPGWIQSGGACYYKHVVSNANVAIDHCQQAGYTAVVIKNVTHMERLIYDLDIGTRKCLTGATLSGGRYTWGAGGDRTFFDRDIGTKSAACIVVSGDAAAYGVSPQCNTDCIICQQDLQADFSVDNVHFYERVLSSAEISNLSREESLAEHQLSCPMSTDNIISSTSMSCNVTDGSTINPITMVTTESKIVPDTLGRESVSLGDGASWTNPDAFGIAESRLGMTCAFWLYVYSDTVSVLFDSNTSKHNGLTVTYGKSILTVHATEPNFEWSTWTWFPVHDWTHVTVTWHETLGLFLYVNAELMSSNSTGVPLQGYLAEVNNPSLLLLANHVNGTAALMKHLVVSKSVWSQEKIEKTYDAASLRYSAAFDEDYRGNWDNLPITRNKTLTQLVWRNSFFYNALHVNNPNGTQVVAAAVSTGQMRNCFTRIESCKGPMTLSFWLRPIAFKSPQTYITAYTPSTMHGNRIVSMNVSYDNNKDVFHFQLHRSKLEYDFTFSMDFLRWSHLLISLDEDCHLSVNGETIDNVTTSHLPTYMDPVQPFSYLEIGTQGVFDIDDLQFFGVVKQPWELYTLRSCKEYHSAGFRGRRRLQVSVDNVDVSNVVCVLNDTESLTVVTHDKLDNETLSGTSTTVLTYNASASFLQSLKDESQQCTQYMAYYCLHTGLFGNPVGPATTWTSLDNTNHSYWAGGDPTVPHSCSCSVSASCHNGALCNCDAGTTDDVTRVDAGELRERQHIPVKSITVNILSGGSARLYVGDIVCASLGYDGIVLTMEEGDELNTTDGEIYFDFQPHGTHVYENGLSGLALSLNKTGFSLKGVNSICFKDISYCKFGVSVTLWMSIDNIPITTSKLQLVQIGGDPEVNVSGLSYSCESTPAISDQVLCVVAAAEGTSRWMFQFHVQISRWMHVSISWNPQQGLHVYLNGQDIQGLGANATVMYNQTVGTPSVQEDLRIGCSAGSDSAGVWRLDDIWLVERDISVSESRVHYGHMSVCGDGWIYNNETSLCYNITSSATYWSQSEAEIRCNSEGGTLAVEQDAAVHGWLVDSVLGPSGIETGVHIGLSKTGNEGSYRWSDGTKATHLPDNMEGPAAAFCVMLEQVTWRHVAVNCDHHLAALCQRSPYRLPYKEAFLGKDNPTFNYTTLPISNTDNIDGLVGTTTNFSLNYAVAQYTDECLNNFRFCHNGWSLSAWLNLEPVLNSSSREIVLSTQQQDSNQGVIIYGQNEGDHYFMNVVVSDCDNVTSTRFEISTFSWVHMYISITNSSNIYVSFNGQNNTYVENTRVNVSCMPLEIGTSVPLSIGANPVGGEQIIGGMDEIEVFEHTLLEPNKLLEEVSQYSQSTRMELNFEYNIELNLNSSTQRLPGKFGYAMFIDSGDSVSHKGQFAFDCFGSFDMCGNGFTMVMWIQPQMNESETDFGIASSINQHRGFMITYHTSHPQYQHYPASYWLTVRDGKTEHNIPFHIGDWFWSHLLLTWREAKPYLFVNGYLVTSDETRSLSSDSYPSTRFYFGKVDDRVTSLDGFSGGVDEFLFWQQPLTDAEAVRLYRQSVYVENPFHWNTTSSGLPGTSLTLTDSSQYLNLTSEVISGSCHLQGGSCLHGLTLSVMLRFLDQNDHDQMILTTGGDTDDGTGVFLQYVPNNQSMPFRRYFKFGTKTLDKEYSVFFNMQYRQWCHVVAEFHPNVSLKVYVDKQLAGEDDGKARTTPASGVDRCLLVGKSSMEVTEQPNFEIGQIDIWDKAVDASQGGEVEDWMHYVHYDIGRNGSTVSEGISLADCYSLCSEDNITDCNTFSFCPQVELGNCYLLPDQLTVSTLTYSDKCDAFIPVKLPYLDYFSGCISDTAVSALTVVGNVSDWEQCRHLCHKADSQFAGILNGTACFCNDTLGSEPTIPDSNCSVSCSTITSETCGGENAVSVYSTGSLQPLIVPSAGIDMLLVTTVPGVVLVMGDSVNFTMEVNNGTDAGYLISTQAIDEDYYTGFNTTSFAADKPGRFTVSIRAMNEISFKDYITDIYVYIPITSISTEYVSFEKTGELISFTVTALNGTNITCEADFGDGNSDSLFKMDDSFPFSFSHTYVTAEVYVVNITCCNNVSHHTDIGAVIVQDVISNIQLSNDNPVRYPDDLNVSWSLDTGTNVTFNLLMDGRETNLENYVFSNLSGSAVIPHVFYNWTGQHALALVAYNLVSQEDYNTSVLIEIPIDQVTIVPNGTFHIVDAIINFTIAIATGSNLTIDLQLDEMTTVELASPNNSYNHVFTYQHSYSYAGEKTINLTVSNIHGTVSSVCTLTTEVSVADVDVIADDVVNPVDFELYVMFKVLNTSDIPTNAIIDIDFGDSSSLASVRSDIQDLYQNITHKYETHGVFGLNVTIYNNVSTKTLVKDLKVGGPISNFTVAVNRMFIPFGLPLIATADVGYGSLITYMYDLGDGTAFTQNYTKSYPPASDTVEHLYNDTENYEVTVWASNSFNNVSETLTVHVQSKVEGLILTSNAPVRMNTTVTFLLTVITMGTDTCFMFDFNDGTVMLYGVASCPSRPEYQGIMFEEKSGSSLEVNHVYYLGGTYNVTVNSSNEVSWDVVSLSVSVLEYLCIQPQVEILGLSKDGFSPVTIKRSKRFELSANIDTQCVPPVNTVYNWVIERVSVSGNQTHQVADVIEEVINPASGLPSMTVPSSYLPYGVYKISLTVSYEKGSPFETTDYSFIEIIPSQLRFSISGDYLRTVYVGDDLVVDGSASHDPDYSGNTAKGLQYKWYCRLLNESLSTDNYSIPFESVSTESPGCFGNGFGYLNKTSESLHVNSSELVVDLVYVFGLVISKDSRVMYGEHRVTTVGSRIFPIEMRCFDNCGAKVVANQPLRLESVCSRCAQQEFPFHWELFFIDADTYQQMNITLWIVEGENTTDVEQTGFVGPNLALNPGRLVPGVDYRLRLKYDAMITERDISINFPPYGGHCYADQRLGMEFKTKFVIYCEDWLDEGDRSAPDPVEDSRYKEPLTFKFSYQARGLKSRPRVFYEVTGTNVHTPEVMFRSGLAEEDHYIDLYVEVADSSGATNDTTLSIRVIPSREFVADVYNGESYARFKAEKDISALLLINMGVIDRLNELRNNPNSAEPVTVQMRENVVSHISEHAEWVETPSQVELMSDILKEVTQKPEELSVTSRKEAVQVYSTLLGSLDSVFNESRDSVTQQRVAKGLCESFIDLMLSTTFNSTCETDCESKKALAASTQAVFESRDSLVKMLLKGSVAGERATVITSANGDLSYKVQRTMASSLSNSTTGTGSEKQAVVFPDMTAELLSAGAASVDVEVMESRKLQVDDVDSVQTRTTSVTLYNHGNKMGISHLSEAISVFVYPTSDLTTNTIDIAENYTGDPFYFKIALERADVVVAVQFKPEDQNASFAYFISYNSVPTNQSSEVNGTLPVEDEVGEQWTLSFNVASFPSYTEEEKGLDENPSVYIGIIPLHDTNETSSVLNATIFSAGCQYYDTQSSTWKHDGLKIGKKTDGTKVECLTSHLTSFGASFFVPPNTIDFKTVFAKFANLADNAAVFSTIIVVIVLYLIVVFFVRRADKKDVEKWSVVPLRDNLPTDVYHYQVTVFTGMRRNAGTKSRVYLVLGGEQGDTEIRSLEDEKQRNPDRGSVNSYVLSAPQSLGALLFLRIWHDNSGKGIDSDWYLNMVVVKDIQTDIKYVFLCDRWLAVDKDDGLIERFIPVSTNEELKSFGHIFAFKSRQDLTDGHLWFSVLSRPTWSAFTRVQRLSCCLSLLFTTMVANAMWYGTTPSQGTQDVHLGPFTFSPQELTTSLMMSLIVVPINLLIVTLFRKASPKPPKRAKGVDALDKPNKTRHLSKMWSSGGIFTVEPVQMEKQHSPKVVTRAPKAKKSSCVWPYWVAYVAWFLVALSIAAPAFFTVLYSLEWGADKSSRWLTSFVLSFVESVLLVQPAKVLAVAMVLALIFKKVEIEEAPPGELQGDIVQQSQTVKENYSTYAGAMKPAHRRPYVEKPPDFSSVPSVREYRKKQNRMIEILKDIGSYVFYLVIVAIICYENRDEKSFHTVANIRNMMVKDIHLVGTRHIKGLEGVSSFEEFWTWSVDRLVPALYLKTTFNGDNVTNSHRSFLGDHVHYRVGPPRLRQARALQDSCKTQAPLNRLITTCIADYGWTNYDDVNYNVSWTPLNKSVANNNAEPWLYQGVSKLNGIPTVGYFATYGGGGYVAVLGNDDNTATNMLLDLKETRWLDRQTRAVILEVNVYNPFVNLFCAVSLVLEFPPTGSAISYAHISPLRMYRYVGPSALFMVVTDLIFVAFTIYFIVRLVQQMKVRGRKYLQDFWNAVEFLNVTAAILCCAFYGMHFVITSLTLSDFHAHPGEFVNFQRIVLWDDVFTCMQGFLLFLAMLKLLRLIRFNTKITQLSTTLKKSVGPIVNFLIIFSVVFFAFTQFAYLVFGPQSSEYFSFVTSMETLFSMLLMKVNVEEVIMANSVLGPLFLFTFVTVVVFILINMLLSILNEVFTGVRLDMRCCPDDPKMVEFMYGELKRVIGFSPASHDVKEKAKVVAETQKVPVERWLAAENDLDRFSPEPLEGDNYWVPLPPNSTDLYYQKSTKAHLYDI